MAGFAGIIVSIRERNISRWPRVQRILLQMLLTASASAVAFALLPAVLAEAQVPPPTIWRIASLSLLIWQLGIAAYRTRQLRRGGASGPAPRVIRIWIPVILLLQTLNLVLCAPWPYLLGVFGILGNGFTFFVFLLLGNADDADAGEGA